MPDYLADYYAFKRWQETSPYRIAGWATLDEQYRRFATLLKVVDVSDDWATLLDVGCGEGCLFQYIFDTPLPKGRGFLFSYAPLCL